MKMCRTCPHKTEIISPTEFVKVGGYDDAGLIHSCHSNTNSPCAGHLGKAGIERQKHQVDVVVLNVNHLGNIFANPTLPLEQQKLVVVQEKIRRLREMRNPKPKIFFS